MPLRSFTVRSIVEGQKSQKDFLQSSLDFMASPPTCCSRIAAGSSHHRFTMIEMEARLLLDVRENEVESPYVRIL